MDSSVTLSSLKGVLLNALLCLSMPKLPTLPNDWRNAAKRFNESVKRSQQTRQQLQTLLNDNHEN